MLEFPKSVRKKAHAPYRYRTEEERKAAKQAAKKRYKEKNKEILKEENRDYQRERYNKINEAKGIKTRSYSRIIDKENLLDIIDAKALHKLDNNALERIASLEASVNDLTAKNEALIKENKGLKKSYERQTKFLASLIRK